MDRMLYVAMSGARQTLQAQAVVSHNPVSYTHLDVYKRQALDGNTVEEEQEKSDFSDNALRYQATLQLLSNRVQGLLTAIRGE